MAFKLERLNISIPIVDDKGRPSPAFQRYFQTMCERIEAQEARQDQAIADIEAALAAAAAAQASADDAEAAAAAAQAAADAAASDAGSVGSSASLNGSFVSAITITAIDAGANATITVSAHTRFYGDGSSVSVNGGSLTGRSYSTSYYIYYDQPSRAGGAVSYQTTTNVGTAAPSTANPDRHFVGTIITPAALGAMTGGFGALPSNVYLPTGFDY